MSENENNEAERVRFGKDEPEVEAHLRTREPAEGEAERVRTGEDEPDVEAHARAFGPPLIEEPSKPERKY